MESHDALPELEPGLPAATNRAGQSITRRIVARRRARRRSGIFEPAPRHAGNVGDRPQRINRVGVQRKPSGTGLVLDRSHVVSNRVAFLSVRLQKYPRHVRRPLQCREVAGIGQGDDVDIGQQPRDQFPLRHM